MRTPALSLLFGLALAALLGIFALVKYGIIGIPNIFRTETQRVATSTNSESSSSLPTIPVTSSTFQFSISNPRAGLHIDVRDAFIIHPSWIAIFDARDGAPYGQALGFMSFPPYDGPQSKSATLLRPLMAGNAYAAVLFEDDGDAMFDSNKEFAIIRPDGEKSILLFTATP